MDDKLKNQSQIQLIPTVPVELIEIPFRSKVIYKYKGIHLLV